MATIATLYHRALTSRPITTQALTAGVLFATGDCIAQHAVEKKPLEQHEWMRTGRLTIYGTFVLVSL